MVVPCHNEEESLPHFYRAMRQMDASLAEYLAAPVDLLLVDDGSRDHTLQVMQGLAARDPHVHYVSFSRNFGKEAGILAGFTAALEHDFTYFGLMDADLQDPPELLVRMLQVLGQGHDVAAAFRQTREGEPPVRSWFAHRFYHFINKLADVELKDGARDFRVVTRPVAQALVSLPEKARFTKGLFPWVGFDTEWIGYQNVERQWGKTNWSFWGLFRYALEGIVAFSVKPLEVISVVGLVLFVVAFLAMLFILIRAALFGDPVAGWPSMMCTITLLSGLQLFGMGILGLYLSKVYAETKNRPAYIVREKRW